MKEAIKKTPKKKAAWKPIEFGKGEHEALDRQIFWKKCQDPKFVARCIAENLKWRRGEGPYAFNADPKKNVPMPLCPQALSLIEEAAIIYLKAYDKGNTALFGNTSKQVLKRQVSELEKKRRKFAS